MLDAGSFRWQTIPMKMEGFTDSVRRALADQNWYAALMVTLTLPDICGKVPNPGEKSSAKRYIAWVGKYLASRYAIKIGGGGPLPPGAPPMPTLVPGDFYALRCVYLHEGRDDITEQQKRQTLNKFRFSAPDLRREWSEHMTLVVSREGTATLVLDVNIFCRDVCDGVEAWLKDIGTDAAAQQRLASLLEFYAPFTFP
jgi:hypothetical protein